MSCFLIVKIIYTILKGSFLWYQCVIVAKQIAHVWPRFTKFSKAMDTVPVSINIILDLAILGHLNNKQRNENEFDFLIHFIK